MKLKTIEQKDGYQQITMEYRFLLFFKVKMSYRKTPDGKIYCDYTDIDRGLSLLTEKDSRLFNIINEQVEMYEKFGPTNK